MSKFIPEDYKIGKLLYVHSIVGHSGNPDGFFELMGKFDKPISRDNRIISLASRFQLCLAEIEGYRLTFDLYHAKKMYPKSNMDTRVINESLGSVILALTRSGHITYPYDDFRTHNDLDKRSPFKFNIK